jgi:hypothetical protein
MPMATYGRSPRRLAGHVPAAPGQVVLGDIKLFKVRGDEAWELEGESREYPSGNDERGEDWRGSGPLRLGPIS